MREIRSLRLVALLLPSLAWGQSAQVNLSQFSHYLWNPPVATVPPANQCNLNSISTAFTCDRTYWPLGVGLQTSGTAGQRPASGYVYDYNLATIGSYRYASDGWNQDTGDNGGRTGLLGIWSKIDNYSTNGGDANAFTCFPRVFAAKSSATQFLASSEASCLAGGIQMFVNGAFGEGLGDINVVDNGFDDAAAGVVVNFFRTNATGNINSNWMGYLLQSKGTVPVDAMERLVGPAKQTFDATDQTYPDQNIQTIVLVSGGTNYVVGDIITAVGGTCDQTVTLKVLAVTGGVINATVGTGFGIERNGMCATPPSNAVSFTNAHGGSQATFNINWTGTANALIAGAPNACWYGNSTSDQSVYNTHFPSTVLLGTSYICYSSSLGAWNIVQGNTSTLQLSSAQTTVANLLTPTLGITASGGTVALNTASNFGTNINSNNSTSRVTIGNAANLVNFGPNETNHGTTFTVATATGCSGTNGTPGTLSGGPQGGTMVGNSSGTGCNFVFTVNGATGATADHAWTCYGSDVTSGVALAQHNTSTTQCALVGTVNATTDTIAFHIDGN